MELAQLLEALREELRGLASPWRTRAGAANHLGCTEAFIDMLAARGEITRHYLYGSPRYKVSELDALIGTKKQAFGKLKTAA